MIATLVPEFVVVVTAADTDALAPLFADEEGLVANAVPERQAAFLAGRACARAALRSMGHPEVAILADEWRAPHWPDGVVGSITHCAGFTAAAVAWRRDIAMLGIDIEKTGALDEADLVVGATERRRALTALGRDADRMLFSAKESIYKAWYPMTRRWLDFTDVVVLVEAGGAFAVDPAPHLGAEDRTLLASLSGRFTIDDGRIATAVYAPA